jgi:CRP-like cAMP-binding protein
MEPTALKQYLAQSGNIHPKAISSILEPFAYKTWNKGDHFLREGTVSNEYLFLEKGLMRSYVNDTEGNEITLNLHAQGQMVFEVASFFKRTTTEENIEALTDCEGWVVTFEQLNHLFHSIPEFRELGRSILVRGFAAFKQRTLSMITKTAEQRYETLLEQYPELFRDVPLKYIASYLGITDSSLSRIRKQKK